MFSVDRPFGVALYPVFEAAYGAVLGRPAAAFRFDPAVTPLSTVREVVVTCVTYLLVIFGGQYLMRRQAPIAFPALAKVHNLALSLGSLALLLLFVEQLAPILARHGLFYAICDAGAWTQRLELLYYINYLFKYWELADTVFLMLKKKPLEFLHYYHHSMTLVLCFTQLQGGTAVSWVPITLNLIVHVVMYYYYFLASCGIRVWWKKHLTTLQITQFVLDLAFVYYCTYTYWASTYHPWLPNHGDCTGTEVAAFFGVVSLSSYLLLFIQFFIETYQKKSRGKGASNGAATNGHAAAADAPAGKASMATNGAGKAE
jgi:hypothetical protein